jgi:uncharacterized protein (TIGR03083 family)
MDFADQLSSLRADTEALLVAARDELDRPVPACPGWTCERLVGHLGRVQRSTAVWVTTGERPEVERPPAGDAVLDWTRDGVDELVTALATIDSTAPVDTGWTGTQPAEFWSRRMAVEAALHRHDAESAVGDPAPIATPVAIDGIDEMFEVVLPQQGVDALGASGTTLHLHATDPDIDQHEGGEWLITFGADGVSVERSHAKGDIAVRGSASDLLLLLWNRVDAETLDVFGDASLLERWRTVVAV